ncbi:hypothetical protein BH10BDE1_BH10BDE1_09820 [soil metagenome]
MPIAASLLPVLVFTAIEELYGTKAGLIAGVVFGVGEVAYEFRKFGRPQAITLIANALVLILGGVSLFESNAVFFKLQPALMVFMMAGALIISSMMGKPFLVELAKKQRPDLPELALARMTGLNLRMGICLVAIALVGVYAAFEWSTAWWAAYKAVGVPVLLVLYVLIDIAILKRRSR